MSYYELIMSGAMFELDKPAKPVMLKLCENGYFDIDAVDDNYFLLKDKTRALTLRDRMRYDHVR